MAKRFVLGPNAAREVKRLIRGSGEISRRPSSGASMAIDAEYVDPFTVKWAQSVGDSGSWIIWLPSDALVIADGETYDMTEDLDEAESDYPEGWYILDSDMISAQSGGTLYLNVEKVEDEDTGEESVEASFSAEASEETDAYSIKICTASVDSTTGERKVKNFVKSAVHLGGKFVKSVVGDTDASEKISGPIEISGMLAHGEEETSCGITFTTVGERTDPDTGEKTPARIIANLKDRDGSEENWGVHQIKFTDTTGANKIAHVLSCEDIEIGGGSGGGSGGGTAISNVIGSDYIKVTDETVNDEAKRKVEAKILTGVGAETADAHALLTHDTEQKVVAKKTFQNAAGTKLVAVDGPNGTIVLTDTASGKSITLNPASIPAACQGGAIGVHEFKFKDKDGNTHKYHGLFCSDVDMTNAGKMIKNTAVSATSNGTQIVINYSDGSSDTFVIQNGLPGTPGTPGDDGEAPEITATRNGNIVTIFADGDLIATLRDGKDPQITASKSGKITTIFADGQAIATINDGEDASGEGHNEWVSKTVLSGIRFQISGGKLQAVVSTSSIWVPNWSGCVPLDTQDAQTINICDLGELDVVTNESYSTSTHQFTNTRKRIKVVGTPADAVGETPFTATSISGE